MPAPFQAEAFIERGPWRFARSMPFFPHEYTLRKQHPDEEFDAMVEFIRAKGYLARWGKNERIYCEIGDWRYWTMGAPIPETTVINRERLGASVLSTEKDGVIRLTPARKPTN